MPSLQTNTTLLKSKINLLTFGALKYKFKLAQWLELGRSNLSIHGLKS